MTKKQAVLAIKRMAYKQLDGQPTAIYAKGEALGLKDHEVTTIIRDTLDEERAILAYTS